MITMHFRAIIITFIVTVAPLCRAAVDDAKSAPIADSEELRRIFADDQADRLPGQAGGIDWNVVGPRDEAREFKVKDMLARGVLRTGADFFHAAVILQHAHTSDDYLLAHDLCVVAIMKGEGRAKWLAATSLDRFLVSVGRPQRFGTQFGASHAGTPMRLRPVDPSVPDELRRAFNVPLLAEARSHEAKLIEQFEAQKMPNKAPEPTSGIVTPRAEPRGAPIPPVAHL